MFYTHAFGHQTGLIEGKKKRPGWHSPLFVMVKPLFLTAFCTFVFCCCMYLTIPQPIHHFHDKIKKKKKITWILYKTDYYSLLLAMLTINCSQIWSCDQICEQFLQSSNDRSGPQGKQLLKPWDQVQKIPTMPTTSHTPLTHNRFPSTYQTLAHLNHTPRYNWLKPR